jgi:hypothetical protein
MVSSRLLTVATANGGAAILGEPVPAGRPWPSPRAATPRSSVSFIGFFVSRLFRAGPTEPRFGLEESRACCCDGVSLRTSCASLRGQRRGHGPLHAGVSTTKPLRNRCGTSASQVAVERVRRHHFVVCNFGQGVSAERWRYRDGGVTPLAWRLRCLHDFLRWRSDRRLCSRRP